MFKRRILKSIFCMVGLYILAACDLGLYILVTGRGNAPNAQYCAQCQSSIDISLNPPLGEDLVLELKREKGNVVIECKTQTILSSPDPAAPVDFDELAKKPFGNCSGEVEKTAQSSPSEIPFKTIFNKISIVAISDKSLELVLKNTKGKVLAEGKFDLTYHLFEQCGIKFPLCKTANITLNLPPNEALIPQEGKKP